MAGYLFLYRLTKIALCYYTKIELYYLTNMMLRQRTNIVKIVVYRAWLLTGDSTTSATGPMRRLLKSPETKQVVPAFNLKGKFTIEAENFPGPSQGQVVKSFPARARL